MNKVRVETLSDGVFAIVMTLLVIELHVPAHSIADGHLFQALLHERSLFVSYFVSFAILTMFWISHHGLLHYFTKSIDRKLTLLNMLYLCFITLIPFSTYLIREYPTDIASIVFYGCNMLIISGVAIAMFYYALMTDEVDTHEVSTRMINQAKFRVFLTPTFTLLGLVCGIFIHPYFAYVFFAFPIVFNIIPGTLDATEKIFGIKL